MAAEASKSQSLAKLLYDLFVARDDIYGVEDEKGWRTERGKLTINHIESHLKGEYTLGIYPFNKKGYVKWLLIDVDYQGGELLYEYMCRKFGKESVILEETGGKGFHIWVFLQPTPLWQIAHEIDEMEQELKHRIFPKQREWRQNMVGNFARLILGKHHKTGNWSRITKGNLWTVKPYVTCPYRIYDQFGDGNCTYYDGTIGYCRQDLCPKRAMLKTVRIILRPLRSQKLWLLRKAEAIPKEFRPAYEKGKYPEGCARIISNAIQKIWQTCRSTKQIPIDKQISKVVKKNGVLYLKIQKELIPFRVKPVDKLDKSLLNHYNSAVVWLKGSEERIYNCVKFGRSCKKCKQPCWIADVQVEVEPQYIKGKPEAIIGIDLGKWHNTYSIWIRENSQLTSKFHNMADCSQTNQPPTSTLNFSQSSKHTTTDLNIIQNGEVTKFVEIYRAFDKFGKHHFTIQKISKKIAETQRNFKGTRRQLKKVLKPLYEKRNMVLRQYYGTLRNKILKHVPEGYNAVFVLEDLDSLPRAELRKTQRTWAIQELANGIFASQLEWNGYKVVKVDARGTTHTCWKCGKPVTSRNDRKVICPTCYPRGLDRDLNGARNIAKRHITKTLKQQRIATPPIASALPTTDYRWTPSAIQHRRSTCTPNVRLPSISHVRVEDNREKIEIESETNEPNKFG